MNSILLATPDETARLGARLARHLPPVPVVLYLEGDLGAGKTSTARAVLRALGVSGPVRSPTYTLIESYDTSRGNVAHLDLYRIADPEELEFLGLDELAGSAMLWLVEWPHRGQGMLPAPDMVLRLSVHGEGRHALLDARSSVGKQWRDSVLEDAE